MSSRRRDFNLRQEAIMPLTTDPNDPRLGYGSDDEPRPQQEVYLVLSDEERAKGFVRPVRLSYLHTTCGTVTSMARLIAESYARNPKLYGATYCVACQMHKPVNEFVWTDDGKTVGS
jgi:hypothetical protein